MDFDEIFADVDDDITEPSCMDKVLIYFEQLREEDEEFIQLLIDKLSGKEITWEQPWYQQSCSLTRKDVDENHLEQYRTDTICKEENDHIKKNWRKLRKKLDLPDKLICLARWRNKDKSRNPRTAEERARRYVTAYLARGLERSLYQVYKHIITYFGAPVKGKYSPTEEKIMKICFYHQPRQAVVFLSNILSRESRGIYNRMHWMLNGKPEKKRIKWTLPIATKFINLLIEYSGQTLEELINKKIDKSVWLKLEEDMGQQYIYLQSFWYSTLHVQIFVKQDVKLNKLRKKIFKKLLSSSYQVWSDIRWKELVKEFPDGFTHLFLYRICSRIVRRFPKYLKRPLNEVLTFALARVRLLRFSNRRLKTLALNDELVLEIVRYDKTK